MSDTLLHVGSVPSVKVVIKSVRPCRGVGLTRLLFTFEITTKQQAVVGCLLWLTGRVELLNLPTQTRPHLASFLPQPQPITLPQLGVDHTLQLTMEVTERQLQLIEEGRTGGVQLYICLSGYAVQQDSQQVTIPEVQFPHDIGQSDWLTMLGQAGYRRRLLLELDPPDPQAEPELAQAIDYFLQAHDRYLEGEWRLTVESLRQSLAAVVGRKADDEDQEDDVQDAFKSLRNESRATQIGYEPRLELVRQTAKFLCDLGAHPEVAETRRHHAYAALVMVGGLLHAFKRS